MTRIAVIADSHFDEHSRFEECVRIHDWIADDIAARGVDLVLHSGDVFEKTRSTARERLAFVAWIQRIASIAPVVIVRGNHDGVGELPIFAALETRHPVIVEESADVHVVAGVAVGCLAWPRRAELVARYGEHGHEATEQAAADAVRACLRGLGLQMAAHAGPRVLLSHAMVRDSKASTGQPLVGCDLEIGVDDLALAEADIVALGHIHMGQSLEGASMPIVYPGSPRRTTYGELEEKAYLLIDIGDDVLTVERITTPSTPMLHLVGTLAPDAPSDENPIVIDLSVPGATLDIAGSEVRLRYSVPSDERERGKAAAAQWKAQFLERGAIDVKVEEAVIAAVRARAPEVAAALSLADKLVAFWGSRGEDLAAERVDSLLTKVRRLEEEHAAS